MKQMTNTPGPGSRVNTFNRLLLVLFAILSIAYGASAIADENLAQPQPPVLSASEIDYPPFSIVDAAGNADGFSVELLRAALAAMGRKVSFRIGPWSDVRGLLERGDVQVLPLVGRTPEREALFDFTFPYMTLHGAIVVRKDTEGIDNLGDLKERRVAVMKSDNAEEFLRRKERGIRIQTTPTFEDAMRELSEGRHDAVVIQRLVALRLIEEMNLENLKVISRPIESFRQDFCFAVREGNREMLALLNEGLALIIADGTYRRLHAKWFAALELPSHRRIVIGGDHNYPPYEYLDENGRPAGYNVDLTRAIAQEVGLDIEIRLGPWTDILNAMARGEIDALQGMFYSHERDLTFDFTAPHIVNHGVSVVRADEDPPPATPADLAGKRIVVQEGDIMHDYAIKLGLGEQISVVDTQVDALRELAQGKHDCALISRLTARYLIKKYAWKNLRVGQQPILSPDYCFAVPEGHNALLAQLGEGLKVIDETGEYRRIYEKWMGVYEGSPDNLLAVLRYAAMVVVPLLALILAVSLWSWSLRRQVASRTRAFRESEARFRLFAELAPVGIVILDDRKNTLYISSKFTEILGYTLEDMPTVEQWWPLAYPDETMRSRVRREWREAVYEAEQTSAEIKPMEYPVTCKSGVVRDIEFRMASTTELNVVVITDITERKKAEAEHDKLQSQFIQAQKMESVGRLAGGVAHDYNNMLSVILGYAELVMERTAPDDPLQEDLREIHSAARHSAEITGQLLAFARKQAISPQVLDLNETVEGMLKMLRRLIGEDINLAWQPGAESGFVKMDPSQIDQILANLCVNARDAIAGVGKVTIETANVCIDEEYCADHGGFVPGEYVLLTVSDDGCGMDAATIEAIFEPFFTTKEVGEGTGLGLATVYGIVKQNNGFINVYSELENGTTFRIYLPRHAAESGSAEREGAPVVPTAHGETVLIVEDEVSILKLAERILEKLGYRVLAAATPGRAMNLAETHTGRIHLLITDVVMPEMNGRDLADQLLTRYPGLKVLFMSGYTANVIVHRGVVDTGLHFIQKPFSNRDLAFKVRETLEQK
jgi:PAS domain S-box-containing protein